MVRRWMGALRKCPLCGEKKPPGEFYARQDRPGRDRPHCRDCHKALSALWQKNNRARKNEANVRYRRRKRERELSRRERAESKAEREAGT